MESQYEGVRSAYLNALCSYTDLTPKMLETLGSMGAYVFESEFKILGPQAYETSLVLLIRNVYFQFGAFKGRWDRVLKSLSLGGPLLDYGCGCGFTGAMLGEIHGIDTYGYELPGSPQAKFLKRHGDSLGIQYWQPQDKPPRFDAVLCTNMLEHVTKPVELLNRLYQYAPKVYANCDLSAQRPHIAPMEERAECIRILEEAGTHVA